MSAAKQKWGRRRRKPRGRPRRAARPGGRQGGARSRRLRRRRRELTSRGSSWQAHAVGRPEIALLALFEVDDGVAAEVRILAARRAAVLVAVRHVVARAAVVALLRAVDDAVAAERPETAAASCRLLWSASLLAGPSSHSSAPKMMPSPQRAVLGSTTQMSEQPSPDVVLRSSQRLGPDDQSVAADRDAAAAEPPGSASRARWPCSRPRSRRRSPCCRRRTPPWVEPAVAAARATRCRVQACRTRRTREALDLADRAAAVARRLVVVVALARRVQEAVAAASRPR